MNELLSLQDLFNKKIFRIPDYQRGYSWTEQQLTEFWEDIINLPLNRDHYTGMISLRKLKTEETKDWTEELWLLNNWGYDAYHVVDGQQRLTSLYIGLKGSRTLKKPKGWWDNPDAFEVKKLYLNLRYQPSEENTEDCYQFEFKNPYQIPDPDKDNYWFKVGEILNIGSLFEYCQAKNLSFLEAGILEKLKNVICTERLISYFEETEKNLDKVLKIFIRVNSGGTKLSYSDLLMSILTANFSSDIRGEMNEYVDKLKTTGFVCFGRDQILKTCLLLIGANHIFNLKNFNKTNIRSIEQNWTRIMSSITDAVRIAEDFGYSGQLASGYIISVIALYLYRYNIAYNKLNNSDKEAMFKFIRTAQITSYFTTSLDRKLNNVLEGMDSVKDFTEFNNKMAKMDANKALKVTVDDVDDLLTLQYGNPAILPVLQVLYPHLDYKNSKFHIDHIYPKAKFTTKNKSLSPDFWGDKNYLFNLQLLEGTENISKKDADPNLWLQEHFNYDSAKIDDYKTKNYIESCCTMQWGDFKTFKEKRTAALRKSLIEVFK
jgi:uncharacterized protein with ParB-like and HNH nuclease domain